MRVDWKIILISFCISRLGFLTFAFLASYFIPLREGYLGIQSLYSEPYLIAIWANFDGRHFLRMSMQDFHSSDFAFFPFYPSLIGLFSKISNLQNIYTGIIISLTSFIVALVVTHKIIMLDYGKKVADLAVILLSFFPLSFFYNAVYSDAIFLAETVVSFYFARKGNWLWSGIFGFLAALTRLAGIALIFTLVVEWIIQNKIEIRKGWVAVFEFFKNGAVAPALVISGIVLYLISLQFFFGDFLLFQKSFSAWQQQNFIFPLQVIFRYLKIFLFVEKTQLVFWIALFEFASLLIYFGISAYVFKKVRVSYGVFMIVLLTLVTFTGTFAGTPRYMLHLFPGFIGMSLILIKRGKLKKIMLGIFAILGLLLTGLFTRGYFVS